MEILHAEAVNQALPTPPPAPLPPPPPLSSHELSRRLQMMDVWVYDTLCRLLIKQLQVIGEVQCGNGVIMSRLLVDILQANQDSTVPLSGHNAFGISSYIGVDESSSSAKNKLITKDMPFKGVFFDADVIHVRDDIDILCGFAATLYPSDLSLLCSLFSVSSVFSSQLPPVLHHAYM